MWAGVECSQLRLGRRNVDQVELTGHDRRPNDLELIASLGVSAVRYPVLWGRVHRRRRDRPKWTWSDERLGALRRLRLEPIVGLLHHGQGPAGMTLLDPDFVEAFADYAASVAGRYPWVRQYTPINEPLTTARFGGLYGWWPPYAHSDVVFARLVVAQALAIRAAARSIKAISPDAQIIVNDDVGRTFSTPALTPLAAFLNERRWLTWDLLAGRVTRDHSMYVSLARTPQLRRDLDSLSADPCPPDIVGIDHYVTSDRFVDDRVELYAPERRNPRCPTYVDVEACRVPDVPPGSVARAIADTWARYGRPIALTEISMAGDPNDQVAWWTEAWSAAVDAAHSGVDMRAVTAWAAFGATDWHCAMVRADGVYEPGIFDASADLPSPRPVAKAIARSAREARLAHDGRARARGATSHRRSSRASAHVGWWTRLDRFTLHCAPVVTRVAESSEQPRRRLIQERRSSAPSHRRAREPRPPSC